MRELKESDWKVFRQLHPLVVERYCQRVLNESKRLHDDASQSARERYLALYQLFRERDEEFAKLFDDSGRSIALLQVGAIYAQDLFTEQEFARFSVELQQFLTAIFSDEAD